MSEQLQDSTPHDAYAVLRNSEFRSFLSARTAVTLALQIQAVSVGWQIYAITHDAWSLGLIGLAEALPSIGVSLFSGYVADTNDRKKIIMSCMSLLIIASTLLLAVSYHLDTFLSALGTAPIYALIFLTGIARGFMSPAVFALMPQLISRSLYSNAVTWNSTLWQAASVAGPALGGLIYGFAGIHAAYMVQVSLLVIGLVFYLQIASRPLPESPTMRQKLSSNLTEGIRFVFGHQVILSAISLDLFAVLFGGAVALLPIFAADILHVGAQGLGMLRAAPAVGSVAMALFIAHYPIKKNAGATMLACVAGFGLCMIGFAVSEVFWISLLLLILSGMLDSVSVIIRSTLIQLHTPDNMKGRVSAVNNIFIGSSNEIGAFESGAAARAMTVVPSVIFGGCMTLLVVGITTLRAKALRKLDL